MKGIIYKATNLFNGLSYIGQTRVSLERRKSQHLRDAKSDSSNYFHIALLQYGIDAFSWDVIDEFSGTKEDVIHALNVAEEYHILKNKTMLEEYGYNSNQGGYSCKVHADAIHRRAKTDIRYKAVLQYDMQGNFIRRYESVSEASRVMGCKSLNHYTSSNRPWRGYQWRHQTGATFPFKIDAFVKVRRGNPVIAYTRDGNFYKEYESANSCHKELGKYLLVRERVSDVVLTHRNNDEYIIFKKRETDYPMKIGVTVAHSKEHTKSNSLSSDIPILQYTTDGLFVKEFPSIISAHRETGCSELTIRSWCKKEEPLYVRSKDTKYIWRYKGELIKERLEISERANKSKTSSNKCKIAQFDSEGNMLKVFKNVYVASLETGISSYIIKMSCDKKPLKKRTEYTWEYYKAI